MWDYSNTERFSLIAIDSNKYWYSNVCKIMSQTVLEISLLIQVETCSYSGMIFSLTARDDFL